MRNLCYTYTRIRFVASFFLLGAAALLFPGCASKPEYTIKPKVSVQDASLETDPAGKITNLSYDQLIAKADLYLRNANSRLAELHYRKALDIEPESTEALIGLSNLFVREGQLEKASKHLEIALDNNPANAQALLLMGIVSRNRGDLERSLEWLGNASEQLPANTQILTEMAITNDHMGQERLTYAEHLYKRVISLKPNSSAAHNNLGFNYLLQGRNNDAVKSFSKALALNPDNQRAKNNLGAAYLLIRQPAKALKLFQDTVGLAAAYNNLGYIEMVRGNRNEAERAFKKALQLNPSFYVRAQQNLERLEHLATRVR